MSHGRDEDVVDVIQKVAKFNGKTCTLTLEDLRAAGELTELKRSPDNLEANSSSGPNFLTVIRRQLSVFGGSHWKSLFETRKMTQSTILLTIIWGMTSFLGKNSGRNLHSMLKHSPASHYLCE
jgi:hypothetical protein